MKRLLLSIFLMLSLGVSFAYAQGTQICFTTNGNNCIKVGTGIEGSGSAPLPVTATISGSSMPLPVGASTAANQLLEIGVLEQIRDQNINAAVPVTPNTATATQGILIGCQYNTTPSTMTDGQQTAIQCGGNRGSIMVGGDIGSGQTDASLSRPVKTGGTYAASPATLTDGQRGSTQLDSFGNTRIVLMNPGLTGTSMGNMNTTVDSVTGPTGNQRMLQAGSFNYIQSGSNVWDRLFTCTNSAPINVTAGSTTQLVALSASAVIRVCNFSVGMSGSGSVRFLYGTGSNCASSPTNLTGDISLSNVNPWSPSSGNGSLFRSAASNALCINATGANAAGFITYAQY